MNDLTNFNPASIPLDSRSKELRRTIVKILQSANRGHIGAAFSLVEILRVLYDNILKFNPNKPLDPDRDRCILSKGHGCLALYTILAEKGFFSPDHLWKFCSPDGILGGHPERGKVPGVEASTGSLGHGLPIGVGMAYYAKANKKNHKVFVIMGDGESNEGSVWEAALSASKHQLNNLIVIIDYNKMQSYSSTKEVLDLEPLYDKWEAFGFATTEVNGHSTEEIQTALKKLPFHDNKPNTIICHTIKGKGVSITESNLDWHHKNKVSEEEINQLMAELS